MGKISKWPIWDGRKSSKFHNTWGKISNLNRKRPTFTEQGKKFILTNRPRISTSQSLGQNQHLVHLPPTLSLASFKTTPLRYNRVDFDAN
jgi:hypothetical protein